MSSLRCDMTVAFFVLSSRNEVEGSLSVTQIEYICIFKNMKHHNYFVYIVTNHTKTVLYIGVTNDLQRRLYEHFENRGKPLTFAGKFHCYNLIYYEHYSHIDAAIAREKELKDWNRTKKVNLINSINPSWAFLNDEIN